MSKKYFILFFAGIALAGVLNCMLIEPAFACKEDKATCQTGNENHGCLTCHSGHHQWMTSNSMKTSSNLSHQRHFSFDAISFVVEPPLRSIFHPPLAV